MQEEVMRAYFILIVITLFIITFVLSKMFVFGTIAGAISAQGGYITSANVSTESNSQHWASRYGEVNVNSGSNYIYSTIVAKGSTAELNLTLGCLGEELYASTSTVSDWSLITAGTTGLVDGYLQLNAGASESAAGMFIESETYIVRNNPLSIPIAHTLAQGSNPNAFELGTLNYSNQVVMVASVVQNTVGFDGRTHDYQILLPTKEEQTTYYFFSDCVPEEEPPPATGGGGGGGRVIKTPVKVPEKELPLEEKLEEIKGKEEKGKVEEYEKEISEIIERTKTITLKEPIGGQPAITTIGLRKGAQPYFKLIESSILQERMHSIILTHIDENSATITLPLTGEIIVLDAGESKAVDFDGDGIFELGITLDGTSTKLNLAYLSLQPLAVSFINATLPEKVEKISPPPLAGKAWGAGVAGKFAFYFLPLTLMIVVMLILIILLFWVKKRQRKRNDKDFKLRHNSKGER